MRVAMLSCDPAVGFGDGRMCPSRLRGLSHALARAGHEVTVICAGPEAAHEEAESGVTVRSLRLPVSVREIDWHFSHARPDAVIERLLPGSLEGAEAAAGAGLPHVYDLEIGADEPTLSTSASVRGALPAALALSRGAVVPGEAAAARLRALMGPAYAIGVIGDAAGREFLSQPPPDQVARIDELLRIPYGMPRILFHGRLERGCGLLPLVRAAGLLPAARRPRIVVTGDGPERNPALAEAEKAGVGLVLCGRVEPREMPAHLALGELAAVPGEECAGSVMALLEAMAMARAVVGPAGETLRRLARHDLEARLVPFDDAGARAGELLALLEDGNRRRALGSQARRAVTARHTWDARVAPLLELREPMVADGAAAGRGPTATRSRAER